MQTYSITSISNEKIKYLKKLGMKKMRETSGEFLVENIKIIHDALKSGFEPISLFATDDILRSRNENVDFIVKKIKDIFVISKNVNKSFSSLATPSGICAVFMVCKKEIDLSKKIVYLNGVSDPGNMGTIIRTCLAFGVENLVVDEKCADVYNPKTIHAAKDAIFKINIVRDTNLKILKKIKKEMKIYATSLEKGRDIKNISLEKKCAIVFGNEACGVDEKILDISDDFIKIDMSGKIESLNVAISAGIVLFETR
ncbi:hypothetical protein A2331_01310 [Candidatus Falkowbacteria bacterium RIFOXYB2_FULL_34_18]|uniref:Uncharacterized protein n=1 Tax=Candidatus Falkowbacteria bacterium RIFOXYD2_FULL_34_120 TaxID=1798007 RepID=A0A1F5TPW4_9BACT|nr:MAG: hypothetical protein A2331_01310 [Candidatus Falkowbacteria bacterium RIFOXYB2_FULL_34_18]OGF29255.1 MAG: hypothetical protein A2500_05190 [Candidatus Falkowbacteria bacterium RIFOXYC12_FULL_34_55]OGF36371.1 MAG: hypothetical protein A2466_00850 [Candidatus Falkowbacteria bacterium RIFOXYC2_FULL_34_220]OGF38850.1 MAG: hypothetical protein A2515_05610 [Candidatus Falkowbacteria bacterium RIFOXYD12_FULL_34_57]OGF40869.1 MAG: hypothetical protein A2531_03835 [Candidatus Falkowbacteria bact